MAMKPRSEWNEAKYSIKSFLHLLSVSYSEGPIIQIFLPLPFMSPYCTENMENEAVSFKSLREFYMVTSAFTFSHIGETQTENVSEHKIFGKTHTHTHC